jgi:polar amino acid transport system substrate-binding protein
MNLKKSKILMFVIGAMCVSLLTVPVSAQGTATQLPAATRPNTDNMAVIRRKGTLDVGVSVFVPWVMRDKNGELIGYEVEVAKKLADDLGVDLKLHPVGFNGVLADLNNGRFDIIITGMYATPERALLVNFTEPLNSSKIELVANREKNPGGDLDDFNDPSVTIGFVSGTVYGSIAADKFPKAKAEAFDVEADLYQAVAEGKITAAIASTPGPEFAIKTHDKKLMIALKQPLGELGESFVIRRGDGDFLNYLNTWIRYYKNSPWLNDEYQKWFVSMDWMKDQ